MFPIQLLRKLGWPSLDDKIPQGLTAARGPDSSDRPGQTERWVVYGRQLEAVSSSTSAVCEGPGLSPAGNSLTIKLAVKGFCCPRVTKAFWSWQHSHLSFSMVGVHGGGVSRASMREKSSKAIGCFHRELKN